MKEFIMYKASLEPKVSIVPIKVLDQTKLTVTRRYRDQDSSTYTTPKTGTTYAIRSSWKDAKNALTTIVDKRIDQAQATLNAQRLLLRDTVRLTHDIRACETADWNTLKRRSRAKCHNNEGVRNTEICKLCVYNHETVTIQ